MRLFEEYRAFIHRFGTQYLYRLLPGIGPTFLGIGSQLNLEEWEPETLGAHNLHQIKGVLSLSTQSSFWDKISKKYASKPVPSEEVYEKKLSIIRQFLKPDSIVLEFGCGTGTTALKLAPDLGQIEAFDYSASMVEIAKSKLANEGHANVSFGVMAIEDISFQDNHYDLVMGHSVLHLTFENEKLLSRIYAGLKPGGYFVSGSGCIKDMNLLVRAVIPVMHFLGKAPAINAFTADELVEIHRNVGFDIEKRWDYKPGEVYIVAQKPVD